jgi:hypothetical protein
MELNVFNLQEFLHLLEVSLSIVGFFLKRLELVYEMDLDATSKALVFCDLLFNLPLKSGIDGIIMRILGSYSDGKQPRGKCSFSRINSHFREVSRLFKLFGIRNKQQAREFFNTLSQRKHISFLCMAHGNVVQNDCANKLQLISNTL